MIEWIADIIKKVLISLLTFAGILYILYLAYSWVF